MPETHQRVLLIGGAVQRSLSTAFQNAGFRAVGIDCRYQAADVTPEQLPATIAQIRGDDTVLGANVTIPHKEAVILLLDRVDPRARAIGAVNTISRQGSELVGWNTDGTGFLAALAELGYDPGGKTAVLAGAGGAARAVAAVLAPRVGQLWVVNRTVGRAEQLCAELALTRGGAIPMAELDRVSRGASLVVNATPADLSTHWSPGPGSLYFDLRSRLSLTGRLMLLHQGLVAFEIWTGRPAPVAAMREALTQAAAVVTA